MKLDWKAVGPDFWADAVINGSEWTFCLSPESVTQWELSIGLDGRIVAIYTSPRRDDLARVAQARCDAAVRKGRKS